MTSSIQSAALPEMQRRFGPGYKIIRSLVLTLAARLLSGALVLLSIIFLSLYGLSMARAGSEEGRGFPLLVSSLERTRDYVFSLVQGDLGLTSAGSISLLPVPVAEVFPEMVVRSFGLLGAALAIAIVFGVLLGFLAARARYSSWSLVTLLATVAGISLPSFFLALLLQMAVIRLTRLLGYTVLPVGGFGWDNHILLPAIVLAARPLAQIARMTFISVSEVLQEDYVRTAHSKGMRPGRVVLMHVLRNVAVPVLTTIGVSLRFSLSSLPVVEYFFSWPGLGYNLLKAIAIRDDNLTLIMLLSLGALFILVNILLDLSYRLIDPRLRDASDQVRWNYTGSLSGRLRSAWQDFLRMSRKNPLSRWLKRGSRTASASPFKEILAGRPDLSGENGILKVNEWRVWLRGTLGNLPFLIGFLLVAGVFIIILFGPQLAPHSPYTTQGLTFVAGEMKVPPFKPDEVYPWGTDVLGRDIMSLILAGAQQTLLLASLVMLVRVITGFLLGALVGWWSGSWIDRLVLGVSEVISAFPTLLLAMTLILALGIRLGMPPFILALGFVGWGEVMQFVRAEVIAIRPRLFIESAAAVGADIPRILMKHVLPNLIPALISIAALEMGAVLMLLGELGFIGIFIGGGAFAELDVANVPYHYSDVPEWGALLSNVRAYARAYPWTALYPSLAFFAAILGFNLFGEGVRRLMEIVGVRIARVVNRYSLAGVVVVAAAFFSLRGSTGALGYYQRQAGSFNGEQALEVATGLADPALQGRSVGSAGLQTAAEMIARQFAELDIQPAGENLTYFQTRPRAFAALERPPQLEFQDGGPALEYHRDFAEYPLDYLTQGQVQAPVRVLAFGELMQAGRGGWDYPKLRNVSYPGEILLVVDSRTLQYIEFVKKAGLLIVPEQPEMVYRRSTLSAKDSFRSIFGDVAPGAQPPALSISVEAADRLLAASGLTVAGLREKAARLEQDAVLELETGAVASMSVDTVEVERFEARHVIGYLPGVFSMGDTKIDDHMVVVMAQYDNPPAVPGDIVFPGANDNASGIAVMLEAIRNMRESGYAPYRTFLFVAYSGEGMEGGEMVSTDPEKFLQTKYGFSTNYTVDAVIELRGLGGGEGDSLVLAAGGNQRLAQLFERAAGRMDVPAERARENINLSVVFYNQRVEHKQEFPYIHLSWKGWEATARTSADKIDSLSKNTLEKAGRAVSLGLMILGREADY